MKDCIELNHHEIEWSDDFMSFECRRCETSFEVPKIFQASTDFRTVLYQMFIFGHFYNNKCPESEKSKGEQLDELLDQTDGDRPLVPDPPVINPRYRPSPNPPANPNDVYWVGTRGN